MVASDNSVESTRISSNLFAPLGIGGAADLLEIPVVFAGFGISTDPDDDFKYDDYEGIDVEGKIVLILRRAPGYASGKGPFAPRNNQPPEYATFRHKAVNAFQHGAKAVVMVNDEESLEGGEVADELLRFTSAGTEKLTTIPIVMVKRSTVDQLLSGVGAPTLSELESSIRQNPLEPSPKSQQFQGLTASIQYEIERPVVLTNNVVGLLEAEGPTAEETIVVGAHYDHLGRGGMGSLAPFSTDIHNGADDNASGTALIIELARRLAARPGLPPRRVLFIAFSGEERGLLGSRYYVNHPLIPLDQTVAMFNFDMVGRLNEEETLTVFGVDSSPGLRELVTALGPTHGLNVRANGSAPGNSDHASFIDREIPIAGFFTGTHRDYHRPSDDIELINYDGMVRISDYAELLLLDFLSRPEAPLFTRVEEPEEPRSISGVSVSLGTIPDYDESIEGVRLNGVRSGSAAEKAGMKEGDIIIKYGEIEVGTIYDFMQGLSESKPGDRVQITVDREGKPVKLEAVLDASTRSHDDD